MVIYLKKKSLKFLCGYVLEGSYTLVYILFDAKTHFMAFSVTKLSKESQSNFNNDKK